MSRANIKPRVLWFCNCELSAHDAAGTGSWLAPMLQGLIESGHVDVAVIACGRVRETVRRDFESIPQWIIPVRHMLANRAPSKAAERIVTDLCDSFSPDVVHVWGTEYWWGLLTARGIIPKPALLTIQGVKYRCVPFCDGMMAWRERMAAVGPKEVAKHVLGRDTTTQFLRWERLEKEILAGHQHICCQTPWQEAQALSCRPDASVYRLDLPLRRPFLNASPWDARVTGAPRIFCSASSPTPLKGFHIAVRALALLKRRHPDIQLRLAGDVRISGWRTDGYLRWVRNQIDELGLEDNIVWLGRLSADQIVAELQTVDAMVIPAFIETYCVAFAEALMVGTPTVVSYTGGTAHLGSDGDSCLFFPPGDDAMCAYQLERVLRDGQLARDLSLAARRASRDRHDLTRIVSAQMGIYEQVLDPTRPE